MVLGLSHRMEPAECDGPVLRPPRPPDGDARASLPPALEGRPPATGRSAEAGAMIDWGAIVMIIMIFLPEVIVALRGERR